MSVELAPFLLLGLVVAGLIKAFVPLPWVAKVLGRSGWRSSIWAAILGAPLPLCSCSVLPVAVGLRRQGASRSATASFLVSTPETGVDSVAVSYALLGPFMTIVRPITAVLSAVGVGVAVGVADRGKPDESQASAEPAGHSTHEKTKKSCCHSESEPAAKSCCHHEHESTEKSSCCHHDHETEAASEPAAKSCCHSQAEAKPAGGSCCSHGAATDLPTNEPLGKRLWDGMVYGMTTLFGVLLKWLVLGLLIAAAVEAWLLPTGFLETWGQSWAAMLVMLLIGIPMYICATSSTPLAAALLLGGVSPGAVLVLLLAGPATNVSTFGVLKQELGMRAAITSLVTLGVLTLLMGWLTNVVVTAMGINVMAQAGHHAHGGLSLWIGIPSLVVLVTVAIWIQAKNWRTKRGGEGETCSMHDAQTA